MPRRPRVAYFSPLNPDPSGIADYSEELLPHLARRWDLDLFVDGIEPTSPEAGKHDIIDCAKQDPVPLLADYDAVLYHIGNSESHEYIYDTLMRWPGLVVLHELSLQHLIAERTVAAGRKDLYMREMRKQHGDAGAERARRGFWGGESMPWDTDPLDFPLNRRVLGYATGVLTFSAFVAEEVRRVHPDLLVRHIDQHACAPPEDLLREMPDGDQRAAAQPAGDPPCRFVTAGNLTPTKGVITTLRALSRVRERVAIRYDLVGRDRLHVDLDALIRQYGLEGDVKRWGRVGRDDLYRALMDADVCICLRNPTLGETSAIAMRALACGLPLVVSDAGWFRELPDELAMKVPDGGREDRHLEDILETLARDPERRRAMSRAALAWVAERSPEHSALAYDEFVRAAGFFRIRWVGRSFDRLAECYRELDIEYAGVAAGERASLMMEMSDARSRPLEKWRLSKPKSRKKKRRDEGASSTSQPAQSSASNEEQSP